MQVTTAKRQYNLQNWAPIIKECKNSGMTAKAWCLDNDIDPQKFYYWQRQLTKEISSTMVTTSPRISSPSFIEIPNQESEVIENSPDIEITIGSSHLQIKNSANIHLVTEILKVLSHV